MYLYTFSQSVWLQQCVTNNNTINKQSQQPRIPIISKILQCEKPDIEFQYKNATYFLDVTFAVEANICNAFKDKILKYGGTYGDNRVIPLVLRYNGTVMHCVREINEFAYKISTSATWPRGWGSKARRRSLRQRWTGSETQTVDN
ncbi:Hypothetical_protein [Hexamita inflata]|uniref:Hypothetical_protein n=1 Tax=Hexamita inflata TaxID=28002 RepID=A0AA86RN43_9EUKA|nr:Hypothetical protein HINF_LOCUS57130 [Hexamita inflata]